MRYGQCNNVVIFSQTFDMGMNMFGDLTAQEFGNKFLKSSTPQRTVTMTPPAHATIPNSKVATYINYFKPEPALNWIPDLFQNSFKRHLNPKNKIRFSWVMHELNSNYELKSNNSSELGLANFGLHGSGNLANSYVNPPLDLRKLIYILCITLR